jgi:hypothetical protein
MIGIGVPVPLMNEGIVRMPPLAAWQPCHAASGWHVTSTSSMIARQFGKKAETHRPVLRGQSQAGFQ